MFALFVCFVLFVMFVLFVCLGFIVQLENFSLKWRRHHCRWRLQILTYAQHSWPVSSEGSLTCHTYCDTGLPFIMVISEDPWHSHLLPSVWQWNCHYLFSRLRTAPQMPILYIKSGVKHQILCWGGALFKTIDCWHFVWFWKKNHGLISKKNLILVVLHCHIKTYIFLKTFLRSLSIQLSYNEISR